jgi:hypothetical protein
MVAPLVVVAAIGTAVQLYGNYQASKSQADAARAQSALDLRRATEVLERDEINRELLFKDADRLIGTQQVQFAASGRAQDVTTLALMEEAAGEAADQAIRNNRAAQWEATMIQIGAYSRLAGADDLERAARISAVGGALASGANIYNSSPGQTSAKSTSTGAISRPSGRSPAITSELGG